MQHITNQIPTHLNGNSPQQNVSQSPLATQSIDLCKTFKKLPPESPERTFLLKFWLRMGEVYSNLWTDKQGDLPSDLWASMLLKVGEKNAINGIIKCIKSGNTFPPTLPEFYALCNPTPEISYVKALPRPPLNKEIFGDCMSAVKAILGNAHTVIIEESKPILADEEYFKKFYEKRQVSHEYGEAQAIRPIHDIHAMDGEAGATDIC